MESNREQKYLPDMEFLETVVSLMILNIGYNLYSTSKSLR